MNNRNSSFYHKQHLTPCIHPPLELKIRIKKKTETKKKITEISHPLMYLQNDIFVTKAMIVALVKKLLT